jgi:hypothetical protein
MSHRGRRQRHPGLQAPSHQLALGFGVVHAAAIALAAADQVGNQINGVLCHGVHLQVGGHHPQHSIYRAPDGLGMTLTQIYVDWLVRTLLSYRVRLESPHGAVNE